MAGEIQFVTAPEEPEHFTATVTLRTDRFADLDPDDAIEGVVRVAPNVTGQVVAEQYSRTFYGWDFNHPRSAV